MATGKRYYWIKLKDTFMTSDAVDFLMGQPEGANYVVLYQMLCLKTINTGGKLERMIGEVIIPYDEAKIQRDCKWFTIDTIRVALNLYKALGLIYVDKDGVLCLTDHENLVGSETDWKEQKRAQRAKNLPEMTECKRLNADTLLLPTGKTQYVDEKRYGGNGMKAYDLAGGKCEMCGNTEDLLIHHANGYSNESQDLYVLCKSCHGKAHSSATPSDWLRHNWVDGGQAGGQEGGHVHTEKDSREEDKDNREQIKDNSTLESALADFIEHRKAMGSPLVGKGVDLIREDLEKLAPGDMEKQVAILNQSIKKGWKGVFPLKEEKKGPPIKSSYDNLPPKRDDKDDLERLAIMMGVDNG